MPSSTAQQNGESVCARRALHIGCNRE